MIELMKQKSELPVIRVTKLQALTHMRGKEDTPDFEINNEAQRQFLRFAADIGSQLYPDLDKRHFYFKWVYPTSKQMGQIAKVSFNYKHNSRAMILGLFYRPYYDEARAKFDPNVDIFEW